MTPDSASLPASSPTEALHAVLDLIRFRRAVTRPELARESGFGRAVITQRLTELMDAGLVREGERGASTGGRAPRVLRFAYDAGRILTAEIGATGMAVGITDLAGELLGSRSERFAVSRGPEAVLERVIAHGRELLAQLGEGAPLWGAGIGVPGPVEYATGEVVAPPIMPGWDRYPIRTRLAAEFGVPVWVDNDVNLMAIGELRAGIAQGERDVIYVKVGNGIGAGIVSNGRLHRGSDGAAGDVGHIAVSDDPAIICRCGNVGCLEAIAGGGALAARAADLARAGASPLLAERLSSQGTLDTRDIAVAAEHGDPTSVALLTGSAGDVGRMLATMVNFHNPSLVILGGGVANSGESYLAAVREIVFRRSLPLATRNLRIARSPLGDRAGLLGGAFMAIDELLSPARLELWLDRGSPVVGPPSVAFA